MRLKTDGNEIFKALPISWWHRFLDSKRLFAMVLLVAALTADIWGTWQLSNYLGANTDLLPRWYAARAWLIDGRGIYDSEVAFDIFELMYGRSPRGVGADSELEDFVFGFTYPPYVALLIVPLAMLPLPVATTTWLLVGQACLLASCRSLLLNRFPVLRTGPKDREHHRISEIGRPLIATIPPGMVAMRATTVARDFGLFVLAAALWPPALANLIFGQFSMLVLFLLVTVRTLLINNRSGLAGVCLAVTIVKPQLVILVIPLLLIASWGRPGWRQLWLGCFGGITVLVAAGFFVVPDWLVMWKESTQNYARVVAPVSALGLLLRLFFPGSWNELLTLLLSAGVIMLLARSAFRFVGERHRGSMGEVTLLIAPAIIGTLLVIPPLWEWNSVLLLIPLAEVLFKIQQRLCKEQWAFGLVILLVLLLSAVTVPLSLIYPNESRIIWPLLVTTAWLATRHLSLGH